MQIPMLDLRREYEYMKKDIDAAIVRCLEHQKWILGPEVTELETKISQYLSVKHCQLVSLQCEPDQISHGAGPLGQGLARSAQDARAC